MLFDKAAQKSSFLVTLPVAVLMVDQFPFPSHQHSFFNQLQLNLRIYVVFTTLITKNIQIKFILIYSSQKLVSLEQLSSNMAQQHIPLFLP